MFANKLHFLLGVMILWLSKHTGVNAATGSAFSLYVYGLNITGMPIFYMNSLAYVGPSVPSSTTGATNITFTNNDTTLYIAKNTTAGGSANITTNTLLYVNTTTTPTQAGFITSDNSTTTTLTTSGFLFDGTSLAWEDSDGTIEEVFWATETDIENVWRLMWNEEAEELTGGTPVVVKNIAPPTEE